MLLETMSLLACAVIVLANQKMFSTLQTHTSYDDGLFTPFGTLSTLSSSDFTRLKHPMYPQHTVRIKKSEFCDAGSKSYTGYIDFGARHLFFYFFESRRNPEKDDVVFWTNGKSWLLIFDYRGPGCSSSLGLFMELGPCRALNESLIPTRHNESWSEVSNLLLLDQPIGVGYSYAEYGESVSTTAEAALDVAAFMAIFFANFPSFQNRALHMAGESYGGRYLPLFAAAVLDQNTYLVESGSPPINLTSVMIGNGMTDSVSMMPSYFDMSCTGASVPAILPISTCVRMKQAMPRIKKALQTSCVDHYDEMDCGHAFTISNLELMQPFLASGMNVYDISQPCQGAPDDLCYPVTRHVRDYLSLNSTRSALGVDSFVPLKFKSCSSKVGHDFGVTHDIEHTSMRHVEALLERGIRVLFYVGEYDWICNWLGNREMTEKLEWSGRQGYIKADERQWKLEGNDVGRFRNELGSPLTFATIKGAGHLVPYDKPAEALEMLKRWVDGRQL